jgi:hypothetical protein
VTDVTVPFGDKPGETATLLLAAAEELDLDPSAVRTSEGAFVVDKNVADKAGVDYESDDDGDDEPEPKPAKKAAKKK